jgi:hypothetical protein
MKKYFQKCIQALKEALPASSRVYFVYTHKNGFNRFNNGLKANTEISYWCYKAIERAFPVRFLRFQGEKSTRIAKIRPQDAVIGHIGPTMTEAGRYTKKLIAFNPWAGHEDRSQLAFNCAPHEVEMRQFDACASLVLLTSEFNKKNYFEQDSNYWYPYFKRFQETKRIRLVHQPIDLQRFNRIKVEYLTNNFLYIGNNAHMKCVEDAIDLTKSVQRDLSIFGFNGKAFDHLNTTQVNLLPYQADFFIQPGMWEAQCVAILEAAARGFIPVVTPETGYPYDHPFLLRFGNFDYNLKIIKKLLNTSSDERKILADDLHEQLVRDINHNNWETLTQVLVEEVQALFSQRVEI